MPTLRNQLSSGFKTYTGIGSGYYIHPSAQVFGTGFFIKPQYVSARESFSLCNRHFFSPLDFILVVAMARLVHLDPQLGYISAMQPNGPPLNEPLMG
jgi:hypothetical protein